jgi:hypothetical protein
MKLLRLVLLALLLFIGVPAPAQPAATSTTPPFRFLILVDNSTNMKRLDEVTPTVIHDLVQDGIYGRMMPGDVYAVWTFSDEVDTTFTPPLVWQPNLARTQAQAIDRQIRRVKYQGKARLEEAVRQLAPIASQSDDLTIIILHDGSGVMFGTPFDLQVTAIYRQFYKDMIKNERPFVTALVVQDKKMIGWAVDAAGGAPSIPYFPRKPKPGDAPPTNTVAKATKPATPPIKPDPQPAPAPKKAPPASIIVKGPINKPVSPSTNAPAVAPAKPATQPPATIKPKPATIPTPEPKPDVTSAQPPKVATVETPKPATPVATITTSASAPVPSPSPKPTLTEPVVAITASRPEDVVKPSDIVPVKTEPAKPAEKPVVAQVHQTASAPAPIPKPEPAPAPTPTPAPAATVAASKAVDSAAQLAQTAVVVPPASGPDWLKLGFGCLFLAGAILTAYFLMRRPASAAHGSVISRSMDRDKGP